jgi:hypothetical protein
MQSGAKFPGLHPGYGKQEKARRLPGFFVALSAQVAR